MNIDEVDEPPSLSHRQTRSVALAIELVIVGACSLLYFGFTLATAEERLLWYDELFTLRVLNAGTWSAMIELLREGLDLQPLAFFAVTKLMRALGPDELSIRLPAILGFWVAGVAVYICQRRWLSAGYATASMVIPWIVFFSTLVVEARPYGLVAGATGLSLLGWSFRARWPAANAVFLAGIAGAAMFHYYGFLAAFPYGAAALWRFVSTRRVDWWAAGACVLCIVPNLLALTIIRDAISFYKSGAWHPPSWSSLFDSYGVPVAVVGVLLLPAFVSLALPRRDAAEECSVPDSETVVCWLGFCALPVVALVMAQLISGMITPRYYSIWILGYALLLIQLVARASSHSKLVGQAIACLAIVILMARGYGHYNSSAGQRAGLLQLSLDLGDLLRQPENQSTDLVVADALPGFQIVHYSPSPLRERIVFLADPELSLRYLQSDTVHKGLLRHRSRFPIRVEPLQEYLNRPQRFLVINSRSNAFLEDYLSMTPGLRERMDWLWARRDISLFAVNPPEKREP